MTEYLVIYEVADDGRWWARAAELPVYAVGATREDAEREIRNAIAFHLERDDASDTDVPDVSGSIFGTVSV